MTENEAEVEGGDGKWVTLTQIEAPVSEGSKNFEPTVPAANQEYRIFRDKANEFDEKRSAEGESFRKDKEESEQKAT